MNVKIKIKQWATEIEFPVAWFYNMVKRRLGHRCRNQSNNSGEPVFLMIGRGIRKRILHQWAYLWLEVAWCRADKFSVVNLGACCCGRFCRFWRTDSWNLANLRYLVTKFHFYFLYFMLFRPILKEFGKCVLWNIFMSFFSLGEKMLGRNSQHIPPQERLAHWEWEFPHIAFGH